MYYSSFGELLKAKRIEDIIINTDDYLYVEMMIFNKIISTSIK